MTTFTELPLSSLLQKKLAAAQFITLTPIQTRAITPALEGKDVIGTAQTGTGKTLAYLIPLIEMLNREPSQQARALVLLPTRELAMQVHEQYEQLRSRAIPRAALIIGGVSEKAQIQGIRTGSSLLIATPGRLQDFITRKLVDLRHISVLVLDEADRMLDMGFLPAIQRILAILPKTRQTLCFSATMEQSVSRLVHEYMREPVRITLGSVLKPAESVKLTAYEVRPGKKLDVLRQLLYGKGTDPDLHPHQTRHPTPRPATGTGRLQRRHDSRRPLAVPTQRCLERISGRPLPGPGCHRHRFAGFACGRCSPRN
jgi:ATP-dependent RNA helicase RhlE